MERKEIACFTVRVLSTENANWQGTVTANGIDFCFQSEMQLLKWLCEQYPSLMPEIEAQK